MDGGQSREVIRRPERGIDDKWGRRRMLGLYASNPTACRMKIDFRTPKKVSPYPVVRGIDFGKYDGLHVPLTPTRNLLMNPSFEGDLRYWALNFNSCHYYTPTNVLPYEVVDGGLFGRHALRLRKIPGDRHLFSFPKPQIS